MITPGAVNYDVVLQGKYFLREAVTQITLEDRLGEIACRTTLNLTVPGDQFTGLPIIKPGQEIHVIGAPFGNDKITDIFSSGVVWDVQIQNQARRHWNVTCYDKTIYLAKSEDEYLFAEGTTATQRIQQIAKDWNIPVQNLSDTKIALAKAVHRAKNLWSILQDALKETAEKDGLLFRMRMTPGTFQTNPFQILPGGLELIEIGKNETIWVLEFQSNLKKVIQKQSLEGAVTQVKVLGNTSKKNRSPVIGTVKGETALGVLQKIKTAKKATSQSESMKIAKNMLAGIQETVDITAIDINTIRAGDRVHVEGWRPELFVINVRHTFGSPGSMTLQLAPKEYIRRRFYARKSVQ